MVLFVPFFPFNQPITLGFVEPSTLVKKMTLAELDVLKDPTQMITEMSVLLGDQLAKIIWISLKCCPMIVVFDLHITTH